MIWEAALRPARRGAHTIVFGHQDSDSCDGIRAVHIPWIKPFSLHHPPGVCTPFIGLSENPNSSAFLIDGGFWTACKESRVVIEKAFRNKVWIDFLNFWTLTADLSSQGSVSDEEAFEKSPGDKSIWDVPMTGRIANTSHYFTMFPHKDLLILETTNLSWDHWGAFESKSHYPFLLNLQGPAMRAKRRYHRRFDRRFHNVAVRYDPEVCPLEFFRQITSRSFLRSVCGSIIGLYIIDPALQRKSTQYGDKGGGADPYEGKTIFYSGDSRYIELEPFFDEKGLHEDEPRWMRKPGRLEELCNGWYGFVPQLILEHAELEGWGNFASYFISLLAVEPL